jgi:hypothetical protein
MEFEGLLPASILLAFVQSISPPEYFLTLNETVDVSRDQGGDLLISITAQ